MNRSSGVIMHISSLASEYGIGTFGEEAFKFADFLSSAGLKFWQVLPLGQTSYGDSPYQCFSAFAGNPYFIDFKLLEMDNLLNENDYRNLDYGSNQERVNYEKVFNTRYKVLRKAYDNAKKNIYSKIKEFREENREWIEDYALYMAIKQKFNLISWKEWDSEYKFRDKQVLEKVKNELDDEINYWCFIQYEFFKQWYNLKLYVNELGIKIIGDIPIYIADDSADAWSKPYMFKYDKKMNLDKQAGCPPDAFSRDGQLWGNPIYNWEYMKKDNYKWWIKRIKESSKLYDFIRIDHFRGFESFWEVDGKAKNAKDGKWIKGPDYDLFRVIKEELGDVNIIAEDLGVITDEVRALKKKVGFMGMKVLEFAFDGGSKNEHLPHNYCEDLLVYTSTHDNNTIKAWFENETSTYEKKYIKKYINLRDDENINWGIIRTAWASTAKIAMAQMQDFLLVGAQGRMNFPSKLGDNWSWRMKKDVLDEKLISKIKNLNELYGR